MRILFVTRKFPPSIGGMEQFAYELHGALAGEVDAELVKWGGSNVWLPVVMPFLFLQSFLKLITGKIDVIHMQDGVLSLMGVVLKWIFNKPLVVVIHGLDVTYSNPIFQAWIRFSLKRTDSIICISEASADEVVKRGIERDKIHVITIGIDDPGKGLNKNEARNQLDDLIEPNLKDKKVILSVGRLVKRKGVAWFVDNVMPQIEDLNTILLISGDGEDREKIDGIIRARGLSNRVFLLGRTSDEVRDLLWYAADVFVMPNIRVPGDMEGFGIVLIQASSRGLPVVASGIEGILDATKNGKNAVHVKPEDVGAFIKSIDAILQSPEEHAMKYREYTLKNYSWPVIANQYKSIYRNLI